MMRRDSWIKQNWYYIPIGIIGFTGIVFFITIAHDIGVEQYKSQKIADSLFYNETCSDLKDSISFFNGLNEGEWIKPYDTSKYEQRMKELNCK